MGTPPQPPPPAQPPPVAPQAQGTPGMAIAALVCGLIGLVTSWLVFGVVLSILAIIFGVIGKRQAEERGGQGSGMAIAGIVTGVIGILILILVIVVGVAAFNEAEDELEELNEQFSTTTFELNFVIGALLLRNKVIAPIRRIRG